MFNRTLPSFLLGPQNTTHTPGPLVLANSVISGPRISVVFVNSACTLCAQVCECPKTVSYITTLSYMPGFTPGEVLLLSPSLPLLQLGGSAINFATFSCWPSSSCSSSGRCCVLVRLQLDTTHNQYNPHLFDVPQDLVEEPESWELPRPRSPHFLGC